MNIIPIPQKIERTPGQAVAWPSFKHASVAGLSQETLAQLRKDIPAHWQLETGDSFHAQLTASASTTIAAAAVPQKHDAYVLRVTAQGIFLDANTAAGLWSGLQTLTQLVEVGSTIPQCTITDHAAIKLRAIHWDLKGFQPTFDNLLAQFRRLARLKYNLVILELEDKYEYKAVPGVGVPGAYTFEQMRQLSKHAKAIGINLVPKIQCIAHADYLLKHPQFAHLREQSHPYQYCPRSDDAFNLWKAMAGEIIEAFAEHTTYFHVGADEADNLSECPVCAKHSKPDNFLFHMHRCLDYIIAQGRTPIMWDDMFRDPYNCLGEGGADLIWPLAQKAIINYWSYGYNGNNNVFPFLPQYQKRGVNVWGSSACTGVDNWAGCLPPLETRTRNIDAWTKTALEAGLECIVATGWTRVTSSTPPNEPQETAWFTFHYAAESMWRGTARHIDDFVDAVAQQLYGRRLPLHLRNALWNIAKHPVMLNQFEEEYASDPRLALLQVAAAVESLPVTLHALVFSDRMFFGQLGHVMPDYLLKSRKAMGENFLKDMDKLEAMIREYMGAFYETNTVDAFVHARFGYCRQYAREYLERVNRTQLL